MGYANSSGIHQEYLYRRILAGNYSSAAAAAAAIGEEDAAEATAKIVVRQVSDSVGTTQSLGSSYYIHMS